MIDEKMLLGWSLLMLANGFIFGVLFSKAWRLIFNGVPEKGGRSLTEGQHKNSQVKDLSNLRDKTLVAPPPPAKPKNCHCQIIHTPSHCGFFLCDECRTKGNLNLLVK